MPESVTVEHGHLSVTSNTASEADLRAELTAGETAAADQSATPADQSPETPAPVARDEKGRFLKHEAAPVADQSATPADQSTAPADQSAEKPTPQRDPTLPKHNPVTRMQQALAQKAEAERRAAALEAELERVRQGVTPPVTPPGYKPPPQNGNAPDEPQFESFADAPDPYTAYMQAWARWDHARQIDERLQRFEADRRAQTQQAAFEQRIADGRTAHPDWDEALTQAATLGLQVSEVMRAAITESPKAADLVHYLATHPEECFQLAEESIATPVAAATVMRRYLESQVSPRPAPTPGTGTGARPMVSTAKPPVTPVGSSPVASDAPPGDEASAAEHARYWNRKLKVPGTR